MQMDLFIFEGLVKCSSRLSQLNQKPYIHFNHLKLETLCLDYHWRFEILCSNFHLTSGFMHFLQATDESFPTSSSAYLGAISHIHHPTSSLSFLSIWIWVPGSHYDCLVRIKSPLVLMCGNQVLTSSPPFDQLNQLICLRLMARHSSSASKSFLCFFFCTVEYPTAITARIFQFPRNS